jgi:hypothetical protein
VTVRNPGIIGVEGQYPHGVSTPLVVSILGPPEQSLPGIYIPPASLPAARLYLEKPLAQHIAAGQVFEQRCQCIGAM